ncbi:jg26626, partial [Pararge aegeria aegeria]
VTPEECLEALEFSGWNVHIAIKLLRVKISVGDAAAVTFEDCRRELETAEGDIVKASGLLVLSNKNNEEYPLSHLVPATFFCYSESRHDFSNNPHRLFNFLIYKGSKDYSDICGGVCSLLQYGGHALPRGDINKKKTTTIHHRPALKRQGLRANASVAVTSGVVRRIRWSQSINENVMRAYYGATEGGNNLTLYRSSSVLLKGGCRMGLMFLH